MVSYRHTTVLENSLLIAVLLSEGHHTQLAASEALHAIDRGFRAWEHIASVSGVFGYLDSTFGDPAIDPLRVDVELLGHFDDRVPRWPAVFQFRHAPDRGPRSLITLNSRESFCQAIRRLGKLGDRPPPPGNSNSPMGDRFNELAEKLEATTNPGEAPRDRDTGPAGVPTARKLKSPMSALHLTSWTALSISAVFLNLSASEDPERRDSPYAATVGVLLA